MTTSINRRNGHTGSLRAIESSEEQEPLLADEEYAGPSTQKDPCPPNPYAHLPVYTSIHR